MRKPVPARSACAFINEKIKELNDWRGETLAHVRQLIHSADPAIQPSAPVFQVRACSPVCNIPFIKK